MVLNDYHGSDPYSHFKNHKVKYYKGYHGSPQRSIDSKNNYNNGKYESRGNNGNGGHKGGKGNNGNGRGNGKH